MYRLRDRSVLLCVGGGIAAYKCADIVRRLLDEGATVRVAMTPAACEFITPLTLQALSGNPVATQILDPGEEASIGHIRLAKEADVVLVAPATADLIARMASGMANDIVTAALLATRAPVVVAPAMNTNMLTHPAVVTNLERLTGYGYSIVPSDEGLLACGDEGAGRLPDPPVLLDALSAALAPNDLAGVPVLVSAGPTREAIDPVRYLTNRSSGRMGYEIARAAQARGADVELVTGPTSIAAPAGVRVTSVQSAEQMRVAVQAGAKRSKVVVMVAAVADYRVAAPAAEKIKKGDGAYQLDLVPTVDILRALSDLDGERLLVGFAAETRDVVAYAKGKLESKKLDLIVANDVSLEGSGFEVRTNRAWIIGADGREEDSGLVGKDELADLILDRVRALLA